MTVILMTVLLQSSCAEDSGPNLGFQISWTNPGQRTDGSHLSSSEIAGYRIYYGKQSGNYSDYADIAATSSSKSNISVLTSGTYYVVMIVIDEHGRESEVSTEVVIRL